MGLFSRLLTLPLEPVRGVAWVAETLRDAAEDEYYDESHIRRQLLELENELSAGHISEQEYEAAEDELVDRLLEAQQRATAPRPGVSSPGRVTEAATPSRRDRSPER